MQMSTSSVKRVKRNKDFVLWFRLRTLSSVVHGVFVVELKWFLVIVRGLVFIVQIKTFMLKLLMICMGVHLFQHLRLIVI